MPTLSIADRLLGSLVGTYIGHGYDNRQWHCRQTKDSQLYQSWLQDIQQGPPPGPTASKCSPELALPWLLYHHDNRRTRHHWLAQTLATETGQPNSHSSGILYCLGDSLEWLMQCPQTVPRPLPLLSEHLQRQLPHYPPRVIAEANQLIAWLLDSGKSLSTTSSVKGPLDTDVPMATLAFALRQCLKYRENLALALTDPQAKQRQSISTIIGCLSGAWGGTAIIPRPWIEALSPDSKQALNHMIQHLYRHWAGISPMGPTSATLPLEL